MSKEITVIGLSFPAGKNNLICKGVNSLKFPNTMQVLMEGRVCVVRFIFSPSCPEKWHHLLYPIVALTMLEILP